MTVTTGNETRNVRVKFQECEDIKGDIKCQKMKR